MDDLGKRPSDYLFQVQTTVSALERRHKDGRWIEMSKNAMRQKLAAHIVGLKMEEVHDNNHSQYRLEVVVMTRSELYALINREAERIAGLYGNTLDVK